MSGRADCPAEPDPGKHRLRGRACLDDDVRPEAPEARERVGGEAELPVRDVLDDQEPVPARELDQRRTPFAGEADAGRILVVGDAVDELRAQARGEQPLQLVHLETVLIHRDGDEVRLEAPKRLDRTQVRRGLDDDDVTGVEVRLGDQLERLDPAARDQQLVVGRTAPLQPLEPICESVACARQIPASARTGTRSPRRRRRTPGAAPRRARAETSSGRGSRRRRRSGRESRAAPGPRRCPRRRQHACARRRARPTVPSRASRSRRQSYAACRFPGIPFVSPMSFQCSASLDVRVLNTRRRNRR